MEGRENTEGVGGGLTLRMRGWRKIRQQNKERKQKKGCERWGESRRTAVVGRNWSMNKNSFANCTGRWRVKSKRKWYKCLCGKREGDN